MIKADFHTHTNFCDGKNSIEEMVKQAYDMGLTDYGISEHAYITAGSEFGINDNKFLNYKNEIYRLKELYERKMNIYFGIEFDILGENLDADYKIGSCHCIEKNGNYVVLDYSDKVLCESVNKFWNGNWYDFSKDYYEFLANSYTTIKCDIIGHFDIITKFNQNYKYFNEEKDEYLEYAYNAMKKINSLEIPFEINTGAISRGFREEPYPNKILLKELYNMGGRIVINSDSHSKNNICYMFDEAAEIAKECGFKTSWILNPNGGFTEIPI